MARTRTLLLLAAIAVSTTCAAQSAAQRREALLRAPDDVSGLVGALDDQNMVVRRTAMRLLVRGGTATDEALAAALTNSDVVVRTAAVRSACRADSGSKVDMLSKAAKDEDALVRRLAVEELIAARPRTALISRILTVAQQDEDDGVRRLAVQALWPFQRENTSLRERKDYDHDVAVVQTIALPKDGWTFRLDPKRQGHLEKWFVPGFDDSTWDDISIEQAWQQAGYPYTGVAWYRRSIELPAKPKHTAVDIHFAGVDESAWVWLNGQYIGQHDIGPDGWDKPFMLDITAAAKWGQENQITVRAMNTRFAGGIWRPIKLEVLE